MSYIEPNTNITVYKGTGLSPNYENTLYFATEAEKDTYWNNARSYVCATFSKCYYQRSNKGTIRVEAPISMLYKADYMRFKNLSFENKYYYAFVTRVNYVSNDTTEIKYVLDPMMTWMGTFSPKQCLVLRTHWRTDKIGDNLLDEGMQIGDYVIDHENSVPSGIDYDDARIIIFYADEGGNGEMLGGVYSGTRSYSCTTPEQADAEIAELVSQNLADNIVGIMMLPGYLADIDGGFYNRGGNLSKYNDDFDGYVPKNNKLFTYPYHKIVVSNNAGAEQTYRPEFFTESNNLVAYRIVACVNTTVQMMFVPEKYKGSGTNWEEALSMPDFPMCSWNYDSYKAWLAQYNAYYPQSVDLIENQNQTRLVKSTQGGLVNTVASAVQGVADKGVLGLATGAISGAIGALANTAETYVNNKQDLESKAREGMIYNSTIPTTAQVTKGKVTPSVLFATGSLFGFRVYDKKIQAQQAIAIDNYFTMYGYTCNRVQTPNMNNRKYYTYVKTSGCIIGGDVPADDAKNIENIFDSGIRFWKSLETIGNYDLVNTPIEEM